MQYLTTPSFEKTFGSLEIQRRQRVNDALKKVVIFFETTQKPTGLGLKKLRKDFWEIRVGLKDRIIFRLFDNIVQWIIVGTHEEIKRYLRHI